MKMTLAEVRRRLVEIEREAETGDGEVAHRLENQLYADVLAQLAAEGSAIARLALRSKLISFARHCA